MASGSPSQVVPLSKALESEGLRQYLASSKPAAALCLVGNTQVHSDVAELAGQAAKQCGDINIALKCLPGGEQLRRRKDRATSAPQKGILKTGWCLRHRNEVFGCVISIIDIDAFGSKESFESAAEAQVDSLRLHLRGRQTRQLLAVVTKADRLPWYDKLDSCQSTLRKKCDLDGVKNVSILHLIRDTYDGCVRLLRDAQDLAQMYYRDECRRLKKVKDSASKSGTPPVASSAPTAKLLQARHQFKLGYLYEARGKVSDSIQHYSDSYDCLRKAAAAVSAGHANAPPHHQTASSTTGLPALTPYDPQVRQARQPGSPFSAPSAPAGQMLHASGGTQSQQPAAGLLSLCEIKSATEVVMFRLSFLALLYNAQGAHVLDKPNGGDGLADPDTGAFGERVVKAMRAFRDHMEWYRAVGCGSTAPSSSTAASSSSLSGYPGSDIRSAGGSSGGNDRDSRRSGASRLTLPGRDAAEGPPACAVSEAESLRGASAFVCFSHYQGVVRQHEKFAWVLHRLQAGRAGRAGPSGGVPPPSGSAGFGIHYMCSQYAHPGYHHQSAAGAARLAARACQCVAAGGAAAGAGAVPGTPEEMLQAEPAFIGQPWMGGDQASEGYLAALCAAPQGREGAIEEVLRHTQNARSAFGSDPVKMRMSMTLSMVAADCLLCMGKVREACSEVGPAARYLAEKPWPGVAGKAFKLQMHCAALLRDASLFMRAFVDYSAQCTALPESRVPDDFFVLGVDTEGAFRATVIAALKGDPLPVEDPPGVPQTEPQCVVPSDLAELLQGSHAALPVEANSPFLSLLAHFSSPLAYVTDSGCTLRVRVATHVATPIPVTSVAVRLTQAGGDLLREFPEGEVVSCGSPLVVEFSVNPKDVGLIKVASLTACVGSLSVTRKVGECPELVNKLLQLSERAAAGGSTSLWGEHSSSPLVLGNLSTTDSGSLAPCGVLSGGYGPVPSPPSRSPFVDRPALRVVKPQPTLTLAVKHPPPALMCEFYPLHITVNAGDAGARAVSLMLPGSQYYEVLAAYEGAPVGEGESQEERTPVEYQANRDTATELFEGKGGGVVSTDFKVGRDLAAGEVWECTVVVMYETAGEHPQQLIGHYETDASREMSVVHHFDLRVVMPYDVSVTACDSLIWCAEDDTDDTEGLTEHLVQNPYRAATFIVRGNIPTGSKRDTSRSPAQGSPGISSSPSPGAHFTELTRLGVSSHSHVVQYGTNTVRVTDAPMRYGQDFFLTLALRSTVESFDLDVFGIQVNYPSKEVAVVRSPCTFDDGPITLGYGEEVSLTWVLRPVVGGGAVRGGALVFAQRSGAPNTTCFSSELPPIQVVRPRLLPKIGFPTSGSLGDVMPLTVYLTNTSSDQIRTVTCEARDAEGLMTERKFLWSGRSSMTAAILPHSTMKLMYHLIPVYPGVVALPAFSITADGADTTVLSLTEVASTYIQPANNAFKSSR